MPAVPAQSSPSAESLTLGRLGGLAPGEADRGEKALWLSGGGYRAALFHLGALTRLNELGLLAQTGTVGAVSGGSIVAALLATRVQLAARRRLSRVAGAGGGADAGDRPSQRPRPRLPAPALPGAPRRGGAGGALRPRAGRLARRRAGAGAALRLRRLRADPQRPGGGLGGVRRVGPRQRRRAAGLRGGAGRRGDRRRAHRPRRLRRGGAGGAGEPWLPARRRRRPGAWTEQGEGNRAGATAPAAPALDERGAGARGARSPAPAGPPSAGCARGGPDAAGAAPSPAPPS